MLIAVSYGGISNYLVSIPFYHRETVLYGLAESPLDYARDAALSTVAIHLLCMVGSLSIWLAPTESTMLCGAFLQREMGDNEW